MTLEGRFRGALLVVVLLSLAGFGLAERDLGLTALAVVGATAGWWVTEKRGAPGMPRWATNAVLVAMLAFSVWRTTTGTEVVSAFAGFLAAIIVLKLWERRRLQDYGQLLTMSLFLTVGTTLTDNSLLLGVTLLVQAPAMVLAVLLFQLHASRVRAGEAGATESPARVRGEWAQMRGAVAWTTVGVMAAGVAIAVPVFLLVPRGKGLSEFGDFARPASGRTTGFNARIDLGQGGLISESAEPVLTVRVSDGQTGRVLGGSGEAWYLRGAVLDQYSFRRGTWERGDPEQSGGRNRRHAPEEGTTIDLVRLPERGVQTLRQEIRVRNVSDGDGPLFAAFRPASVQLERPAEVWYDAESGWIARRGPGGTLAYEVTSLREPLWTRVVGRGWPAPFPSERVRRLAAELLAAAGFEPDPARRRVADDSAAARVFETHLRTGYAYSLDVVPAPLGTDPTEWFLITGKRGHCEYFASGLAALCRGAGMDARVVTGYLATEFDAGTGWYTVRASNAHAWVEVDTTLGGWQTRDATPQVELQARDRRAHGWLGRLGGVLDAVQDTWNATVVSFDQTRQARMLGARSGDQNWFDRAFMLAGRRVQGIGGRLRGTDTDGRAGRTVGIAVRGGIVVFLCGAAWMVIGTLVRRKARESAGWEHAGLAGGLHRELWRALRRRGVERPSWAAPLEWIERAGLEAPVAAQAAAVERALYAVRYGGRALSAADAADLRRAIAEVRRLPGRGR